MRIRRIDKTRWDVGKTRIEYGWRWFDKEFGAFGVGWSHSDGGYEGDESQTYLRLGFLKLWITRDLQRYRNPEWRYGWELSLTLWQRWFGEQTGNSETEQATFCLWRERLLDWVFGKTVCTVTHGRKHDILIHMPEGDYPAVAKYEWRCWTRPRWLFHRMRLSTDVDIPKGIPFQGKGENSWDCGDDGLFGSGCAGHDLEKAASTMREIVMHDRRKYGEPSAKAIRESLGATE
jgi:hypothetical protein